MQVETRLLLVSPETGLDDFWWLAAGEAEPRAVAIFLARKPRLPVVRLS